MRVNRECLECGAAFVALTEPRRPGTGRYCSKPCLLDSMRKKKTEKQRKTFADRFWARVETGDPSECWPWTGPLSKSGYGSVSLGNKNFITSRIAYELTKGPIPEGLNACHHCDNPKCCNPQHLYPGTHEENMEDIRLPKTLSVADRIKHHESRRQ